LNLCRIVIQANPPFLVVHANAAYSRLTGLHSHTVVGKPIASLMSLAENEAQAARPNEAQQADKSSKASGTREMNHPRDVSLERLVAASGFGHLHFVQVAAKPHQMLGRNMTICNGAAGLAVPARTSDGPVGVSLASRYEGPDHLVTCRTSIAPIVSSSVMIDSAVVTDKQADVGKRRKHLIISEQVPHRSMVAAPNHRRQQLRPLVTHYVIQLDPHPEGSLCKPGSAGSLSSHSSAVEACLLGTIKKDLQRQCPAIQLEDEGVASESTEAADSLSVIG
jgi:hypothetical protein